MGWWSRPEPEEQAPPLCVEGHQFEPRYDEVMPRGFAEGDVKKLLALDSLPPLEQHYVRDICIRCGKIVDRVAYEHEGEASGKILIKREDS